MSIIWRPRCCRFFSSLPPRSGSLRPRARPRPSLGRLSARLEDRMFLHACILNARRKIPVLERKGARAGGHARRAKDIKAALGAKAAAAEEDQRTEGEHRSSAVCSSFTLSGFALIVNWIFWGICQSRQTNTHLKLLQGRHARNIPTVILW